jgi:type II secretory pathway pseudopilin PulG
MYREAESMGRRSNPRLLLLLLRTGQNRNQRQRGFSLALVLMVLMVAMVSSVSLAVRSTSSHSGSLQLSASRQAREAAENGITEIVGELNRPQNRRLLVSGTSPANWGSATDTNQRNPCENLNGSVVTPTASVGTATNNTWKSAGGNGQYVLRSVRYANRDRSARLKYGYTTAGSGGASQTEDWGDYDNNTLGAPNADVNLDPVPMASASQRPPLENFGYLQLEVQGRVLRPGSNTDTLATATVVKEYEVIPKCCNRSFSGPSTSITSSPGTPLFSFGNDQRACGGTADLGLLFGFNGGALTVNGTAGSVQEVSFDSSGNQLPNTSLDAALCITTSTTASNCVSPNSTNPIPVSGGSTVPVIPTIFDVDPPPTFGGSGNATGSIIGSTYIRVKSDSSDLEQCTITVSGGGGGGGGTPTLASCNDVNFCERVGGSSVATYQCRMSHIRLTAGGGNDEVYFDTSRGSIALFFNEPGTANDNGTVFVGGSSRLYHRYCSTSPTGNDLCTTPAPTSQFTRLSFFGNQTYNDFTFRGGGEPSIFIYFPQGNVLIGDNSTSNGAIWTKNLTLNGSFTSAAPATNCAKASSGFCYILRGSLGTGQGGGSAALFDWVARSPATTRVY